MCRIEFLLAALTIIWSYVALALEIPVMCAYELSDDYLNRNKELCFLILDAKGQEEGSKV